MNETHSLETSTHNINMIKHCLLRLKLWTSQPKDLNPEESESLYSQCLPVLNQICLRAVKYISSHIRKTFLTSTIAHRRTSIQRSE